MQESEFGTMILFCGSDLSYINTLYTPNKTLTPVFAGSQNRRTVDTAASLPDDKLINITKADIP